MKYWLTPWFIIFVLFVRIYRDHHTYSMFVCAQAHQFIFVHLFAFVSVFVLADGSDSKAEGEAYGDMAWFWRDANVSKLWFMT